MAAAVGHRYRTGPADPQHRRYRVRGWGGGVVYRPRYAATEEAARKAARAVATMNPTPWLVVIESTDAEPQRGRTPRWEAVERITPPR